jgi:hypothetical protein
MLLPPGSFKETINNSLDIVFTPKYLSVHTLLKVVFAGTYVCYYDDNMVRIPIMSAVLLLMLVFNARIQPCCVEKVNSFRTLIFAHGAMTGVASSAYLIYQKQWLDSTEIDRTNRWLYLLILGAAMGFHLLFWVLNTWLDRTSPENAVASAFVAIENSPSGVGLGSRLMEPLVAMALSHDKADHLATQK